MMHLVPIGSQQVLVWLIWLILLTTTSTFKRLSEALASASSLYVERRSTASPPSNGAILNPDESSGSIAWDSMSAKVCGAYTRFEVLWAHSFGR